MTRTLSSNSQKKHSYLVVNRPYTTVIIHILSGCRIKTDISQVGADHYTRSTLKSSNLLTVTDNSAQHNEIFATFYDINSLKIAKNSKGSVQINAIFEVR